MPPAQTPGGPIVIECGAIRAGTPTCVTVTSLGAAPSVTVEVNGVRLRTVITSPEPGVLLVCFPVPAGAGGGDVVVTATGGGQSASSTQPIADL